MKIIVNEKSNMIKAITKIIVNKKNKTPPNCSKWSET